MEIPYNIRDYGAIRRIFALNRFNAINITGYNKFGKGFGRRLGVHNDLEIMQCDRILEKPGKRINELYSGAIL